jgi:hypothetical protein
MDLLPENQSTTANIVYLDSGSLGDPGREIQLTTVFTANRTYFG